MCEPTKYLNSLSAIDYNNYYNENNLGRKLACNL